MGMAASQARYLELTARKTDVEYQGQQINQQRTELANESAGLFSKLMGLTVPTAPSSSDYTTTSYTFNDGANDNTIQEGGITTLTGDAQYNANVTYSSTASVYTGVAKSRSDLTAYNYGTTASPVYWLGTTKLTAATYNTTTATTSTDDTTALEQIAKDASTSNVAQIYKGTATGTIYKYTSGSTTYYVSSNELDTMIANGGTGTLATCYAGDISKTTTTTDKAYVTKADTGRYESVTLASSSTTFDLTASTSTNNTAYNDAMNEYNYQEALYQQQVTNINAKTSVIQQQDKNLELQLKQLDTEQQALSTEMDSVKKVIDKNIEQTFKTFSS